MSKILKNRIEKLEQKHRAIAENVIDAIWVVNTETLKFEYVTPSIERISGYTPDEFINLTIMERATHDSWQKVKAALAEDIDRFHQGIKSIRTLEVELINKNGDTYWAELKSRLIKDPDQPLMVFGVTRDITDHKKAEQEQDELIKKLEGALAEKERLLEEVKVLRGLLPICSGCKRIRDENGKWWPIDAYVRARTDAEITHTICPDCTDVLYADLP